MAVPGAEGLTVFPICGGPFVGGFVPLDGTIENLRVVTSAAGADVTWEHAGVTEPNHRLVIALDGELVAVLPSGTTSATITGFDPGDHRIDVLPIRADVARIPDLHGDPYGDRAFISWPASPSEDLEAYEVFMDDEPAATIAGSFVQGLHRALPASGSGTGLLTVSGSWTGRSINRVAAVEITEAGFEHDLNGEPVFVSDFEQGDEFDLPNGIRVRFDSPRADYELGDRFEFQIGPRTSWASGKLAPGEHTFTVRGRDRAGNLSGFITETTVAIFGRPAPVSGLTAAWDGEEIALAWTPPDDPAGKVASILVFANWSPTLGALLPRINMDAPIATLAAHETSHALIPEVAGLWRIALVTTHADHDGRSESAETAEIDTTGVPTGLHLAVPGQVAVEPAAGGTLRVRWRYNAANGIGEDVTVFRLYVFEAPTLGAFEDPVVVAAPLPGMGGFIDGQAEIGPFDGARWVVVRASNGTVETQNEDASMGIPDDVAPTMTGTATGVPN